MFNNAKKSQVDFSFKMIERDIAYNLKNTQEAMQRLTQITSMLAEKLGYDIHAVSGGPVKLIKNKNK